MKISKRMLVMSIAALITGVQGCATTGFQADNQAQLNAMQQEIDARDQRIKELEAAPGENAQMVADSSLLPPNAKPGECYARVWVPASYRRFTKDILVKEESERTETIPSRYEWAEERVLIKQASSRYEKVPAVYGEEIETIKVKDASRVWKTGLERKSAPASPELIAAAKAGGINLDTSKIGMCFHEHYRPAEYKSEEQEVLISEVSEKVVVSTPKYRWVEKQVLVREASSALKQIPAVYGWEEEKVIDKPAHTIWQKGTGPIQRIDEATGEIMCLVEVPATYKTIKRRVVKTPARTEKVEIPAEYDTVKVREMVEGPVETRNKIPAQYKTVKLKKKVSDATFMWHEVHNMEEPASTRTGAKICITEEPAQYETVTRTVVKAPATVRKVEIPAEYKAVKVRKLVSGPEEKRIKIPGEYKTVTLQELEKEGHMEWRSILCKTNMTGTRISQIQSALKDAGYNPGPIDGLVGQSTMAAVNSFQKDKGLPVDKYLNVETLKALGVSAR